MQYGFQVLDSSSEIPDFLNCISYSKAQDSRFHKQNFLDFRIRRAKIFRILESGFPCMGRAERGRHEVITGFSFWFYARNLCFCGSRTRPFSPGFNHSNYKPLSLQINVLYKLSPLFTTWTSGEYWTCVLPGGLCANEVKIVVTLTKRTHYQKNFFETIFRFEKN